MLIDALVNPSVGSKIVLENDIEEEIGITDRSDKNKPFVALTHVRNAAFSLPPQMEQKIRLMYA